MARINVLGERQSISSGDVRGLSSVGCFSYIFASQGGIMNGLGWHIRGPHCQHRLDRADLDRERRHLAAGVFGRGWVGRSSSSSPRWTAFLANSLSQPALTGATEPRVWRQCRLAVHTRGRDLRYRCSWLLGPRRCSPKFMKITRAVPTIRRQSLMTYMYQQAFANFAFGYAAGIGVVCSRWFSSDSVRPRIRILRQHDA